MIEIPSGIVIDVPLLPFTIFNAGKLTCVYEAGNIRCVKYDEIEIVRMIYGAVRDKNWNTIIPFVTGEVIKENENGISIGYTANYNAPGIEYKSTFAIRLGSDNTIEYSMKGTALSSFEKNRIGICVLHPLKSCVGQPLKIVMPDGNCYHASFPELIAPHQPFKDIQQMHWQPAEQLNAALLFEGETYETEDQRNWGDSSYKTYGTPLANPYPEWVHAGDTMEQKIVLTVTGNLHQAVVHLKDNTVLQHTNTKTKMGYLYDPATNYLNETFNRPVHHLRVELLLNESNWFEKLLKATGTAQGINAKLELVLFFDDNYDAQLSYLMQSIEPVSTYIYSILLLHRQKKITPMQLMEQGYATIKANYPFIKTGYGTEAYFTVLNRNPPVNLPYDFVGFSLMPQIHASDIRTIVENLECLPAIIKTVRSFTDRAIHVSPLSLHKMKNHDAVTEEEAHIDSDPLRDTGFAASWIEQAVAQLEDVDLISIPFH